MANYINITFGDLDTLELKLSPVNNADSNLYFDVVPSGTTTFNTKPKEEVRVLIAPNSASLSDANASGLLRRAHRDNSDADGYYYTTITNATDTDAELDFNLIKITDSTWENTKFDLFWLQKLGDYIAFSSNTSGVYGYPSNISKENVLISGNLVTSRNISYNIRWPYITNEGDVTYSNGPYRFRVIYWDGSYPSSIPDWTYHGSGVLASGIAVDLPFYNENSSTTDIPSVYTFVLQNAGPTDLYSNELVIKMDHQKLLSADYLGNIDNETFTTPNPDNIKLTNQILIDNELGSNLDRTRMSIGIDDIAIKDNSYQKQGTYVSQLYPLDFEMYTFSLKVDEVIPEYPNIVDQDVIKYFVEFNSNQWEQISPITRRDELNGDQVIPKLFIFDTASDDSDTGNIKYLNYGSTIGGFRVKIVFDLSSLVNARFAPPEVHDYKCLIFDKDQFFNI